MFSYQATNLLPFRFIVDCYFGIPPHPASLQGL